MNTIQTQSIVSPTANNNTLEIASNAAKPELLPQKTAQLGSDHYSATGAHDAVVAKVISSSIDQSLNKSVNVSENSQPHTSGVHKRLLAQSPNVDTAFSFETVTANVIGFVENALSNLAKRGFETDQLSFYRNEAISGVKAGIELAKTDLSGIANDEIFRTIDNTMQTIIGGIEKLSVDPSEYEHFKNNDKLGVIHKFSSIEINNVNNELLKVDFETKAFKATDAQSSKNTYTTSSSNITFSVEGTPDETSQQSIANLMNKLDSLANSFYRGDVQNAYNKSIELGYNDKEIVGLAKQIDKLDSFTQMKAYEDIQHLDLVENHSDFAAPRTIAEYVNKYLDVIESSSLALGNERDFNQVINGLVNQMKDVQIPDVLQAINRFHAFNNQFS